MNKKSIYLFYGDDQFSLNQKIKLWEKEFEKKYGDINISVLDENFKANDIIQAIEAAPFLAEKRLTIIRNFLEKGKTDEQKIIAQKLENYPENSIAVFAERKIPDKRLSLYKKLNKIGNIEEYKVLNEAGLTNHIQKEIKKFNGNINYENARYLGFISGTDLFKLKNEINKLILYCGSNEITKKEIDLLVSPTLNTSIFALTDLLSKKNAKESIKTLHNVLESGEEMLMVFFMIVRQFRLIIQIRNLLDLGLSHPQIQSKLREHPFVIRNTLSQSKNFTYENLKKIYKDLLDIDIKVKTGQIKMLADDNREFLLELEQFIIKLCC